MEVIEIKSLEEIPEILGNIIEGYEDHDDIAMEQHVFIKEPIVAIAYEDGSVTYATCQEGDTFNPLFGIMACVTKRIFDNNVRVDAWEPVFQYLADSLDGEEEMFTLAEILVHAAYATGLPGVKRELSKYDVRGKGTAGD